MKIKICGITRVEDATLAADLGAAALGFVFWPGSPRFIDPYSAMHIVKALPPFASRVGVFVDQPESYVRGVANLLTLAAVQLHGSETPGYMRKLRFRLIKAVGIGAGSGEDADREVPDDVTVLLDAHDPVRRGGTGRPIDWSVAAAIARRRRVILSGGLCAENVGAAIEAVRPYAVDVSSGVEECPGVKDHAKLRAFFEAAQRSAEDLRWGTASAVPRQP